LNTPKHTRKSGFTLLELMITVLILAGVMGSISLIAQASQRAYQTGAVKADLEARTAATIEQVVAELSIAGRGTLTPDILPGVGVDALQYMQATGMDAGEVVWTPMRRLAFEYEIGELDDGIDNNGNGLIDEGRLVLTEDLGGPGERERVLTRWVRELAQGEEPNGIDDNGNGLADERGFTIQRAGDSLILMLTLEKRNAENMPMVRTGRTSTKLRN
jgi:prepilin-type N-terminal cleavage/methylation domain-containing protein